MSERDGIDDLIDAARYLTPESAEGLAPLFYNSAKEVGSAIIEDALDVKALVKWLADAPKEAINEPLNEAGETLLDVAMKYDASALALRHLKDAGAEHGAPSPLIDAAEARLSGELGQPRVASHYSHR